MSTLLILLSLLVAIIFASQVVLAAWYVRQVGAALPLLSDKQCPRVAVILCLRGHDPSLAACLQGLFNQDYPHYELMIVADQPGDTAWQVASQAAARNPHVHASLRILEERRETCSLKCSALVQAVNELEECSEVEVYALLDQDVVPHPTWLRELVAPLVGSGAAVSCGYRWFMPEQRSLASLIRAQWNAGSVVFMVLTRICWGGSLALRTEFIHQTRLLEKWSRAICEDTMVVPVARKHNARVTLLPSLAMVDQQSCSLASLFPWIRRQTLFAFLYNPDFREPKRIAAETYLLLVTYSTTLAAAFVATCVAIAQGNSWANLLGPLLAGYTIFMIGFHWCVEAMKADLHKRRGGSVRRPDIIWPVLMLFCFPISQLFSLAAALSILHAPVITWRGVSYRIRGPLQVEAVAVNDETEEPSFTEDAWNVTHQS